MDDLLELDLKLDEQMLTFNIPDEVLERVRKRRAPGRHLGILHYEWHYCEWPQ